MDRYLLVISTRGYAPKGHVPHDEFCSQWGFDQELKYKWSLLLDGVALLILHGCKDEKGNLFDPAELVRTAAGDENGILIKNKVYGAAFYHHSIGGKSKKQAVKGKATENETESRISKTETEIKKAFNLKRSLDYSRRYNQGGSIAVEELKKDILSIPSWKQAGQLVQAIEMTAAGLPILVAKLRDIQSALLRLSLLLEAAKNRSGISETSELLREVTRYIGRMTEGSRTRLHDWLGHMMNSIVWRFSIKSVTDWEKFFRLLKSDDSRVSRYIVGECASSELKNQIETSQAPNEKIVLQIAKHLNGVLQGVSIYNSQRFETVALDKELKAEAEGLLGSRTPQPELNWKLIEAAYPNIVRWQETSETQAIVEACGLVSFLNSGEIPGNISDENRKLVAPWHGISLKDPNVAVYADRIIPGIPVFAGAIDYLLDQTTRLPSSLEVLR